MYILCQSKTFCATPKDVFYSVNFVFVPAEKFFRGTQTNLDLYNIFWDLQKELKSVGFQIKIGRPKFYSGEMITPA